MNALLADDEKSPGKCWRGRAIEQHNLVPDMSIALSFDFPPTPREDHLEIDYISTQAPPTDRAVCGKALTVLDRSRGAATVGSLTD